MNWLAAVAVGAAALLPAHAPAADSEEQDTAGAQPVPAVWLFGAQRIHHNDAMPLAAMDRDDHRQIAPRPGRNLAYIDDELRIERRSGPWAIALLARSQATLVADGQGLQLARLIETGQRPDGDRQWRTDARLRGFSGAGVELRRTMAPHPGWTIDLSTQLLALGSWQERDIRGAASYDARSQTFDFDIASDQLYNRLGFAYQQRPSRLGTGLLFGAGLRWADELSSLRVGLNDGGPLRWNQIPRQTLSLAANRQGVDADGFVVYGPLLEGRNRQDAATRWQPWRAHVAAERSVADGYRATAGLDWLPDYGALPWVGAARRIGAADFQLQWRLHEARLTAALDWQGFTLRLGTDRLGSGAHSREAVLAYRLELP